MTTPVMDEKSRSAKRRGGDPRHIARIWSMLTNSGEAYALVALTVLTALFFCALPKTADVFPSAANLQAISGSQAVLVLAGLALLFPLICGEFDLSVGANIGLAAVLTAKLMSNGTAPFMAIVVGVLSGAVVGLVNGVVVAVARVPAVVMTLGTTVVIQGLIQQITSGVSISSGIAPFLLDLGSNTFLGVPTVLITSLLVAAVVAYILGWTPIGRQFYMLGDNRVAAALVGLRVNALLLTTFVIGGVLAGIAGVLLVGRSGSATPGAGDQYLLPAFAAAFLSAAAIRPGRYNVGGVLTAVAFLAVLNGGLNLAGAPSYVNSYLNGAALILGVALAAYLGRRRTAGRVRRGRSRDDSRVGST